MATLEFVTAKIGMHRSISFSLIATALALSATPWTALSADSDERVLAQILGDRFLAENVTEVRRQAAGLLPEERYRFLSDWILPSRFHRKIRLSAAFTPTHPIAPAVDDHPVDLARLRTGEQSGRLRIETGGLLISPVFDLIDTARRLNCLSELRTRVEQIDSDGELSERRRLALLVLVSLAAEDVESVRPLLDELERRISQQTFPDLFDRWPETLVAWRAVEHPDLLELTEMLLPRILNEQVRPGKNNGPDAWDRLFTALAGRMQYSRSTVGTDHFEPTSRFGPRFDFPPPLQNWVPVTGGDCATRALGFPCSRWEWRSGSLTKLSGHQDEFLYFRIPLRGDYTVECDLAGFGYADTHLMVSGAFHVLHGDHEGIEVGGPRGIHERFNLSSRLSETGEWIHCRVAVQNGVCSTHLDGRLVHEQRLIDCSSPWLAIRSPFHGFSRVRNLQVNGTPDVPQEIRLTCSASLPGWVTYFPEIVGSEGGDWRFDPNLGPEGGLFARHKPEFAGIFQESLLRYHRPLLEDGVIEYEFLYRPGKVHIHPAIDRKAFLINPEGVRIHWVTDGTWDRSGNDPLNAEATPDQTPAPARARIPLVEGWNQLRLELEGDTVTLNLNGQPIHQSGLNPTNDRTFGLFRYADQTEGRVRNMVWRGNWPRELPLPKEQELRRTETDVLDTALPRLTAVYDHDFQTERDWRAQFNQHSSDGRGIVNRESGGARMTHPGSRPFNNVWIAPAIRTRGDFDVVAEFDELQTITEGGKAGIYLSVVMSDPATTHCQLFRGLLRQPDQRSQQIMEAELDFFRSDAVEIVYAGKASEAATSGRLRLTRRGSTVSFLISEEDSTNWRLVHQQEVNATALNVNGVRLTAGTYADGDRLGSVSVLWKRLTVRAESISEF